MQAVLLFPGQGAQKVGMGQDLYTSNATARELMDQADAALGFSLTKVMFEGPEEELTRTCYCQPALFLHGLVIYRLLCEQVSIEPIAAAGLSLGEFTAHASVGTFSMQEGLRLVQKRGIFMEEACQAAPGAMAALIGGTDEAAQTLASECGVDVANYNCPGQVVVSGVEEGVNQVVAKAKAAGFKLAKKLNVAGAYHSRLMKSAQQKLIPELEAVQMSMPSAPVYCNCGARPVQSVQDIRETLGAQVCSSVRWAASMQDIVKDGHRLFIEMGPGKTLAGMMTRICKEASVISIEDASTLQHAVEQLRSL